jgi:hypothetical protein
MGIAPRAFAEFGHVCRSEQPRRAAKRRGHVGYAEASVTFEKKENPQMLSQMRAKASLLLEEISGDYRVI